MELNELLVRAKEVKNLYAEHEREQGHKPWTVSEYQQGFVGDVGDLTKLIMIKQGFRGGERTDEKLAHELGDCLYALLVIADELEIDLEQAFEKTMSDLKVRLSA
jgi:NTP pyrophosphatase (non-canonical NTP hydrolase)